MTTAAEARILTIQEAAEQLNAKPLAIRRVIARGRLTATRVADEWRVSSDNLVRYFEAGVGWRR